MHIILVLGKNGQLASSLSSYANKEKFKLIFLGRNEMDLNLITEDIFERFLVKLKPSLVINAAGYTNVEEAELNSEISFKINGFAVGLIARCCSKKSIPLIHISSDYVFGDNSSELLTLSKKQILWGIMPKVKPLVRNL